MRFQVANEKRQSGKLTKDQLEELAKILSTQKQTVYQELPLVLDSGSYYTIERPYGILLQVGQDPLFGTFCHSLEGLSLLTYNVVFSQQS
jgi:hypothetical protein